MSEITFVTILFLGLIIGVGFKDFLKEIMKKVQGK